MNHKDTKIVHRTSAAALMGVAVTDMQGRVHGHVRELAVTPAVDPGHIAFVIFKSRGKLGTGRGNFGVPVHDLRLTPTKSFELRDTADPQPITGDENYLLLERDLLDQQIIDVSGRKVVRVNDVELEWKQSDDETAPLTLQLLAVDTGLRGAVRRLLKGLSPKFVEAAAGVFHSNGIPWEFVNLIEPDPARRVRLRIQHERLGRMHPSDIAEILEELAPAQREAVFSSLDEEVAAEALEEADPRLQKRLLEGLDSGRVADIVEEMDPGAAADLLSELSDEKAEDILEEMEPEERQEVEDLLEFHENSAAGRMTTEFVHVPMRATVADAVQAMRDFEGDVKTVSEIFMLDDEEVLQGVVPVSRLLLAQSSTPLEELAEKQFASCKLKASADEVVDKFDKYNLHVLPVLDAAGKLQGVVLAEQVIALLHERL
jgi:CBS domain-containing protein